MAVRLHRRGNGNYYALATTKDTRKAVMLEIERIGDGTMYMPVWMMTSNEPGDTFEAYQTLAEVRSGIERLYHID